MTLVQLLSDVTVKLVRSSAEDSFVVQAAQVSAKGENNPETDMPRLIRALMEQRHGSPFEHTSFTFFIKAPIFVFREFHRHRTGWSYNEQSGRYSVFKPEFYLPDADRKLVNHGTSMRPDFGAGSAPQVESTAFELADQYQHAWDSYERLIARGITNEVARLSLPVAIFSSMYATCNARSLMHFLSLRTEADNAINKGKPQWEIQMVANKMEALFAEAMPITHGHWNTFGRVAP